LTCRSDFRRPLGHCWLAAAAALLGCVLVFASAPARAFAFEDVDSLARGMAAKPWAKSAFTLPKVLKDLSYDQARDIRFNPARSLWRDYGLQYDVQFFHLGHLFEQPVKIHEIVGREVREVAFDPADFDYGKNKIDRSQLRRLGFAGFRIHYTLNTPKYKDELAVFLGASYFRALGQGQRYGVSARGLAIDTAEASGEEFPRFEQFWIVRPRRNAREVVIYALLDSQRMAGAYQFTIRPGAETVTEVRAALYARGAIGKLGIAPLTSMYLFGENQRPAAEDFRPEVHDSDGLSIQSANGEWIWRPLVNPRRLLVTSFGLTDPRGFGLLQRDRHIANYEDLESRYELRPSVWVEPIGAWGPGRVELVQIPTPDETNDNIVAYWVPQAAPKPGTALNIAYKLYWQKGTERRPPHGWVQQTRRGAGHAPLSDGVVKLTVDFDGPALRKLPDDAPLTADVSVGGGQSVALILHKNDATGTWRMVLQARRTDKDKPMELRAFLRKDNEVLSETWSYIVPPI